MAYADYIHCEICDTKAIYDANINYEYARAKDMVVLCPECAKHVEILIRNKLTGDLIERTRRCSFLEQFNKDDKE